MGSLIAPAILLRPLAPELCPETGETVEPSIAYRYGDAFRFYCSLCESSHLRPLSAAPEAPAAAPLAQLGLDFISSLSPHRSHV